VRALLFLLLWPALALAQPVDLVHVDKSERRLSLISQGKVVRQFNIARGTTP